MNTIQEIKDYIEERGYESVTIFDNPAYCGAFIGVSHDERAIYDYNKMVQCLMSEDGMEYEDAVEFIDYNTIRALPYIGDRSPIVLYPVDE